jgi:transposase-like protein
MADARDFDLPLVSPTRWTPRRKAAVILAIRERIISVQEACERYDLSAEELAAWERDLDRFGVPGLRATRIQIYRDTSKPK